jgi:threonine/homoserine/homoserine lactone efflux protein
VVPTSHLVAFLLTVGVLIVIPGPSVMFVVSRGVALGRRAALATVAGNTAGLAVQLTLVAVGLGAIVARSEPVFTVLKLVGAGYLVLLGARNIRDRRRLSGLFTSGDGAPKSLRVIVREGFVVGATNPKGFLIFTVVVPQFIARGQGHTTLQLATLGAIAVLIGLLCDSCWAVASGTARDWLGRSPRALARMTATGGVMLIGLGVGLAVTGRRS